jgi:transcriptional regulator, XRE family
VLKPKITIAEIRAKHGKMSQEEFGASVGVSAQTVGAWEKDILKISPIYLLRITEKYGVSSSDLLGA